MGGCILPFAYSKNKSAGSWLMRVARGNENGASQLSALQFQLVPQATQAQFVLQIKNYKGLYGKATGLFQTVEIRTISQ